MAAGGMAASKASGGVIARWQQHRYPYIAARNQHLAWLNVATSLM